MKKIVVLLADGFEESEMIVPVDVLRRAQFQVDLMSIDSLEVVSSHGLKIIADKTFSEEGNYDALFIPGGQPGTNNLVADERVLKLIQRFTLENKIVAAICAAPLVLAKAGVLQAKKVTSYPMKDSASLFKMANYADEDLVVDGKLITGRGVGVVFPFAYALAKSLDADVDGLKRIMVYPSK